MERITRKHFHALRLDSQLSEGIIDPAQDLKYLPFWIIAEIIYGEIPSELEEELRILAPKREALFRHVIAGGLPRFKWSKYLYTATNRDLASFKAQWSSFNRRAREHAIENDIDPPLIQMYQAVDSNEMTEEELLQTLDEMLFANLDVTIGGVSWNLVFLAANPAVQERLRAEIIMSRRGSPALFSQYLLSSSTYLAACISESARLRPLAAFSVPQAVPTARVIGGYYFEAGTNFVVDSYALNQRNPYWGDDSSIFQPDRFFRSSVVQARYNFWRFGFGPRQCMGKYAADVMIRVLLVYMMEEFVLSMDRSGDDWGRNMESWINHPQLKLKCEALASHKRQLHQ
ncbi:cytochrome p450 oxidoreductase [Phlyctema vagabunda]|uniref:Cytochrome p450 oxidoreductase n=1 Tax=Phlyctema vagabunda TaxID=108571 RepID=A0ABR4PFJ8_9HELO